VVSAADPHLAFLRSVLRSLVTASVAPSSPIPVTLMKEMLSSSEMSVLKRVTRCNIPDDAILQYYVFENWLYIQESHSKLKNGVFWDVTICCSYKKRRFGGTYRLLHKGDKNR
jgi:hypothetical protein